MRRDRNRALECRTASVGGSGRERDHRSRARCGVNDGEWNDGDMSLRTGNGFGDIDFQSETFGTLAGMAVWLNGTADIVRHSTVAGIGLP